MTRILYLTGSAISQEVVDLGLSSPREAADAVLDGNVPVAGLHGFLLVEWATIRAVDCTAAVANLVADRIVLRWYEDREGFDEFTRGVIAWTEGVISASWDHDRRVPRRPCPRCNAQRVPRQPLPHRSGVTAMDDRTLTALKESIAHWERNARAKTPHDAALGADNCALCGLFNISDEDASCAGCPVRKRTGQAFCEETPYEAAWERHKTWLRTPPGFRWFFWWRPWLFRVAARDMLDFLRSLLPREQVEPETSSTIAAE